LDARIRSAELGTADDAAAIVFLLRNGFTSGVVLDIDGGWH
jgi:hypothetical protein